MKAKSRVISFIFYQSIRFGQPPAEIIKELAPELEFDEEGMPKLDGMNMPFPPMMGMPNMNVPPGGVPGNEECIIM